MSRYALEVVLRRVDAKGCIIEETIMDETADFETDDDERVRRIAAVEAAMLVHDTLAR